MKKLFFCALAGVIGFAGAKTYLISQESDVDELTLENVEAWAEVNHEGGMANKYCPIWNVSYTKKGGVIPSIEVTCTTGGSWKCEKGKCPHERYLNISFINIENNSCRTYRTKVSSEMVCYSFSDPYLYVVLGDQETGNYLFLRQRLKINRI